MKTFPVCQNCGWSGPPRHFTLTYWCDACFMAYVRGFLMAVGIAVVGLAIWLVVRTW